MLKRLYLVLALLIVTTYAFASWRGWEFGSAQQSKSGPSVRTAGGGRYYHSGYRGGK